MTRILYIPSGDYIQFYKSDCSYTEIFEDSNNINFIDTETPEKFIDMIILKNFSRFLVSRVGYVKHIRAEFEIIEND